MKDDPLAGTLPNGIHVCVGNVCDPSSLDSFLDGADGQSCVIHCAGIVSVASRPGEQLYKVNVGGTKNIVNACISHSVGKLVYVSSVHALPEKPKGETITEDCRLSPELVEGGYAKTKAEAANLVFEAARQGLDASVVFPSGIIGPGDLQSGSFTTMAKDYLRGRLPLAVRGGYDFVDVRDMAVRLMARKEKGEL